MTVCDGNGKDHCCYIDGNVCRYMETDIGGRKYSCRLRRELGSWAAVHNHDGYKRHVKPVLDRDGVGCGDWPPKGRRCAECGATG